MSRAVTFWSSTLPSCSSCSKTLCAAALGTRRVSCAEPYCEAESTRSSVITPPSRAVRSWSDLTACLTFGTSIVTLASMSSISRLVANVVPPACGARCATLPPDGASARGASLGADPGVGLGIGAASAAAAKLLGMPASGGAGAGAAAAVSGVASFRPAAPAPPQPVASRATEAERATPKPGNLWCMTGSERRAPGRAYTLCYFCS